VEIYSNVIGLTFNDSANTHCIYFCQAPLPPVGTYAENHLKVDILRLFADLLTEAERTGLYFYGIGTETGIFTADISSPTFQFFGQDYNANYGININNINKFENGWASIYNFIQLEYAAGSYASASETWVPKDGGLTDKFGQRIYSFENLWMSAAEAATAVTNIFNMNIQPKRRITLTAPIVPQLNLFDVIYVNTGAYMGLNDAFYGALISAKNNYDSMTGEYLIKEI
jgi:hypothetical protein